jgi:small subunit ribosomal protein S4
MKSNDKCRICRRVGEKLFLKGEKCNTPSCAFAKKSYAPGHLGPKARLRRGSDYSIQLREKQKARAIYGVSEKQMSNYFNEARKDRSATGAILLQFLERRLGYSRSRNEARQMVSHGKVKINGKRAKTASQQVSIGDKILVEKILDQRPSSSNLPSWIGQIKAGNEMEIKALPQKDELSLIDEQLIIEFYSR